VALGLLACAVQAAQTAQGACERFAGEVIRWIIPYTVGGGYDTYSRAIGPAMADRLGADMVFDNVTGGGGRLAAQRLRRARPDGLTVGIVNASTLLADALNDSGDGIGLRSDFSILGRISGDPPVWAVRAGSDFERLESFWSAGRPEPVFASAGLGARSFLSPALGAPLLRMRVRHVTGYEGSRESVLGVLRGDVDVISSSLETLLPHLRNGDLKAVLMMSDTPLASVPELEGVALLGGRDGVAARRAREEGADVEQAVRDAGATIRFLSMGRLVVAPPALPDQVGACLGDALAGALADAGVTASLSALGRPLDPAGPETVWREIEEVSAALDRIRERLRAAAEAFHE
jgi:tripartite-type tricarboxylate transporter receptor subunit TctC